MIQELFKTNVLIKDNLLDEDELASLEIAVQAIFTTHLAISGSHIETGEDNLPLFTDENTSIFPVLKKVKDIFVNGFLELSRSHDTSFLEKKDVERMMDYHSGRLPIMKKGDYKQIHCHPGASAFGIFYVSTVNNVKEGGKLVLRDPSFHTNLGFHNFKKYEIETKASRLIIAPAHVWHEVTPYSGDDDRITIVSNLLYASEDVMYAARGD